MGSSLGDRALTTKVDEQMVSFVESESDRIGVSRAEFIRRVLEVYRESWSKNLECHNCGSPVMFPVEDIDQ